MIDDRYMSYLRMEERLARADRAIAEHVAAGKMDPKTALAVLHQVADSLSDGEADFHDHLIPQLTEAAASSQAERTAHS